MLELKKITKEYLAGDSKVEALKGINMSFRKNEFVSILGPSGCGKTTLLNIIGGLDRYTTGDLIINGKSTTEFKDKDWDAYRNYAVGFVFQNYNLIPHQTVLSNVELALTLSGISKEETKKRAIKALEDVGLKDQIYKKPNQMSGGQMQRVAIARALVNNPDIILADEPTGALDTQTSTQIMEILKEISKEKLIIMVTHNPELAEKYSSRIIKVLDGKVIDDTNIYDAEKEEKKETIIRRTSMKFFTAFRLSLNNLMTKKGRTFLTSFAGSIGIIGIALILSISNGVQNYINGVEQDTLSSYPISIQEESIDISSMMLNMMSQNEKIEHDDNKIYSRDLINNMLSTISTKMQKNNLKEFKNYIESKESGILENANAIQYGYNTSLNIYKSDTKDGILQVNPSQVMDTLGMKMNQMQESMMSKVSSQDVFTELINNQDLLKSQYNLLAGKFPENKLEVVLIVDANNEISDYTLYALGLKDQEQLKKDYGKIENGQKVEKQETLKYTYEDLLNLKFKLVLNSDYYQKEKNFWTDMSEDENYMTKKINNAEDIQVVGIIQIKPESTMQDTTGEIGYTKDLVEYVIKKENESIIVKEQKKNEKINVFTGLEFEENASKKLDMSNLTTEQKKQLASLNQEELAKLMQSYAENASATYETNLEKLGAADLDSPSSINIYPKNFETKTIIADKIEEYNQQQQNNNHEENVITYTDLVGMMIKSVSLIVDVISYVLIAFVAISLIVSSIMIGIITYISVLERTKEIGILRAIGASKKDISRVFNAETLIVGLVAGALGIGITILLCIPINSLIVAISGVSGVSASLPIPAAIILVIISMLLTMIAGLIPAKMASKKDPVEALRTE